MTTVLFSSSRAGSSIFKTANIGRLTFLLPFSRQEIHEKSFLYFTFKIINIHNRSCRKFFLPLLNPLFIRATLQVFNWPVCSHQNLFFFQNKGLNDPIWVGIHTIVVQAWLKEILLVYHSAIMSTKWRNMKATPTLILLEDISVKIIGRDVLYS